MSNFGTVKVSQLKLVSALKCINTDVDLVGETLWELKFKCLAKVSKHYFSDYPFLFESTYGFSIF